MGNMDESDYENLGIEDGTYDRNNKMSYQASFGSSVNLDELSDEEREAYELGYEIGAENYDLYSDDEEDF
ncbi:hypothetical protein IKE82_01380 [Candidatus Saccharibacteria bacterium]|nr:hypothetical protein [Candidatus Saccharibacteria bacterium]